MITQIEDYFSKGCGRCARFGTPECSARVWAEGLALLRALCLEAGLEEQVKWGHPCYRHAGRNIAIIGAFRGDFRLTFFNAGLLSDPQGVLERRGPNTHEADLLRFTDTAEVAGKAGVIRAFLDEAKGHAEAGRRAPGTRVEVEMVDELQEALARDAALSAAFDALTPGRRRGYLLNLAGAKKPETRRTRIERFRPAILAGKGLNEG